MSTSTSSMFTSLNHHNITYNITTNITANIIPNNCKQHNRSLLYNTLVIYLQTMKGQTQWCYLLPYIEKALQCFHCKQALFMRKPYITIKNKDTLRNILYFLSKRDYSELHILLEFIKKV
jgi:hypothetical protein